MSDAPKKPFRIVFFGPESTGKTSLARTLAERLGEPWSEEYVRRYWDDHQGHIAASDLEAIARGQIAWEDATERSAREVSILDTDLLTCTVWDDLLFPGSCPLWVRTEAVARARRTDLYLLCLTDIPVEPDPQRSFPDPEGRAMCMRYFRKVLEDLQLPYLEISGQGARRQACVWDALQASLARVKTDCPQASATPRCASS